MPAVERLVPLQAPPELVGQHRRVWPVQADRRQLSVPMAPTSKASIATTEVLVSPKGEMIAVAPLTNEKGSLLSACAPAHAPRTRPPPPRSLEIVGYDPPG